MIQFSEVKSEQSYLDILRLYQLLQRKLKYSFNTSQITTPGFSHSSWGCFIRLPGPYGQTNAQRRNANVRQLTMWRFCFLRSWKQKSVSWTLRFQLGWSVLFQQVVALMGIMLPVPSFMQKKTTMVEYGIAKAPHACLFSSRNGTRASEWVRRPEAGSCKGIVGSRDEGQMGKR